VKGPSPGVHHPLYFVPQKLDSALTTTPHNLSTFSHVSISPSSSFWFTGYLLRLSQTASCFRSIVCHPTVFPITPTPCELYIPLFYLIYTPSLSFYFIVGCVVAPFHCLLCMVFSAVQSLGVTISDFVYVVVKSSTFRRMDVIAKSRGKLGGERERYYKDLAGMGARLPPSLSSSEPP